MITKYKTGHLWRAEIEVVQIERETENSVWIKGSRCAKSTTYENYFDTWEEARAFMVTKAGCDVDQAHRQLDRAIRYMNQWKELVKPEGE